MPRTGPLPQWQGPAYLIGGGASLRHFDFGQLRGRQVIGCNQAFLLGSEIVPVAVFGDFKFWCHYARELGRYAGWVVSPRHMSTHQADWIHFFERQNEGLATDRLAWNGNTGAAAINLALILGASPVYLLGYDCGMDSADAARPESSHWHDERLETPSPEHYARFAAGFASVARALPAAFPGREVYNVSDGRSRLTAFPVASFCSIGLQEPKDARHDPSRWRPGRTAVAGVRGGGCGIPGDGVGGSGQPLEEPPQVAPAAVHC